MGFFSGLSKVVSKSVTLPFRTARTVLQGHPMDALNNVFHEVSGDAKFVTNTLGIHGWVGDHPLQTAGAAIAAIYGGAALMGGSAAASGAGALGTSQAAAPITAAIGTSTAGTPITYSAAQAAADGVGSSFLGSVGTEMGKTMLANTMLGAMGGGGQQQPQASLPGFNYGGGQGIGNSQQTANFNPQQGMITTPGYDISAAAQRFI